MNGCGLARSVPYRGVVMTISIPTLHGALVLGFALLVARPAVTLPLVQDPAPAQEVVESAVLPRERQEAMDEQDDTV
jgi:hypothetical protein